MNAAEQHADIRDVQDKERKDSRHLAVGVQVPYGLGMAGLGLYSSNLSGELQVAEDPFAARGTCLPNNPAYSETLFILTISPNKSRCGRASKVTDRR